MGRWIEYIPEELAWIEARKDWTRRQLHAGFCARFDRKDVSLNNFKSLCKRKGWLTGRTGCFVPGQLSHNKGKKGQYAPGCEVSWFKKGQRPINKFDVGYESTDGDGYVSICIDQQNPYTGAPTRMYHKHRWLWEMTNGPVPDGYRLKCLDGDRANTDPSNWEAIPMALGPRLNGAYGMGYDKAEAELKPTIMAIAKLEHCARTIRKGKSA